MRLSATLGTDYQATGKLQRRICLTKMECRLNDPRNSILLWFQVKKKNHKLVGGTRRAQASLVAQSIKNPPATRETWVGSLSQEDPLEEGMATHSCKLAWRILMNRRAWQAIVHGVARSRTRLRDKAQYITTPEGHRRQKEVVGWVYRPNWNISF